MINRTKAFAILFLAAGVTAPSAQADFKLERTLALEPGRAFVLEADIGDVTLTGSATSGAQVVVTSDENLERDFDFAFDESAQGVKVTIKRRGLRRLFSGWFDHDDTRVTIRVPSKTDVRLSTSGGSVNVSRLTGTVDMHTSGGSIQADAVEGNVDGTTSGGGVRIRDVRGDVLTSTSGGSIVITEIRGNLRANTSGGGINIDGVSGEVHASTSGGSVDVRGAGGRVEARSSGGGVTVRFAAGNGRGGVLSSSGGSVRTELDPGVKVSIDAKASGGSVNCDVPVTIQGRISNDSLRGTINGGGALLELRSNGGGVRISANALGQRANGKGQK